MSYVRNWLHCVWGTKNKAPFLTQRNKPEIIQHIWDNAKIKGEASFGINKNNLCSGKFEWADEYFAVSVSESHKEQVRAYINNQEKHHRKKTWEEEYSEFIKNYNFE